ncbi:MAG: hypothetical protein U5N55_04010 [Cypionkella sp.]|nr:hypothetical protein [Cypionkella sp.]
MPTFFRGTLPRRHDLQDPAVSSAKVSPSAAWTSATRSFRRSTGKALNYIPFLMVSHESLRPARGMPPLLDSVPISPCRYFKNSCDREHAIFPSAGIADAVDCWVDLVPIDRVPTSIGSGTALNLPEGTASRYARIHGRRRSRFDEGVDAVEKNRHDGDAGARMLSVNMNRNETIDTATQRTRSELVVACTRQRRHDLRGGAYPLRCALLLSGFAASARRRCPFRSRATSSRIAMEPKMVEAAVEAVAGWHDFPRDPHENFPARRDRPSRPPVGGRESMIDEEGGDLSAPIIRPVA